MPTIERIIPVLTYRDIPAAHDFLVQAFGFASGGVHRTPDGQAVHGEVRAGEAAIWLHRVTAEHHLDSPLATDIAGARIDSEPVDQPYGQREYGARDLEGHRSWLLLL